jgi:hypothetical protein
MLESHANDNKLDKRDDQKQTSPELKAVVVDVHTEVVRFSVESEMSLDSFILKFEPQDQTKLRILGF